MSNRFTKYTADKLRSDGWLDKEQADTLRTRLQQVESERDKVEADAAVMRGLLKEARYLIIEHHSHWVLREEHVACPVCSSSKGDSLLNRIEKALHPCPTCGGVGGIDSGGVTPWGSGISIPYPSCNYEGDKK